MNAVRILLVRLHACDNCGKPINDPHEALCIQCKRPSAGHKSEIPETEGISTMKQDLRKLVRLYRARGALGVATHYHPQLVCSDTYELIGVGRLEPGSTLELLPYPIAPVDETAA